MLNVWLSTFQSCTDGRCTLYAPMTLVAKALAAPHRNTLTTERTLKAMKTFHKHGAPEIALQHANHVLIIKSDIAQDPTLVESASTVFYGKFVQNWR